jgi:large subunit ribosomal protein L22
MMKCIIKNLLFKRKILFSINFKKYNTAERKENIEEKDNFEENEEKKIKFVLRSPPVVGKNLGKFKPSRITAKDLPKRNPKEEAKWPTCRAVLKDEKQSYKKMCQIVDVIRRLSARQALQELKKIHRRPVENIRKTLQSAMFNAENNHNMNGDRLVIKEIFVTKGTYLKRLKIHAKGRRGIMERKKSHVTIILMEVPEQENERRLGDRGWKNSTWEKYYQRQLEKENKSEKSENEEILEKSEERMNKIKEEQIEQLKSLQFTDEQNKILKELKEMDDEEKKNKN